MSEGNVRRMCGSKRRQSDQPCRRAPMANGRCHLHGGRSGRPIKHGRYSRYHQIFGERYAELATDPEILQCQAELALIDTYLLERAEHLEGGLSAEWMKELHQSVDALRIALFVKPDAQLVRRSFEELEQRVATADARMRAWGEVLAAARVRADVAIKADAVAARREATMTEASAAALLRRVLEIVADVAGHEIGRQVVYRVDRELFGSVERGEAGKRPAADRIN